MTTIFVGFFAGLGVSIARQVPSPHRDASWLFVVPAIVAAIMWARSMMASAPDDGANDAAAFFLLVEKLLVAYLAFAVGWAIGFLAA